MLIKYFIERQGKLHRYPGHFSDNEKLYQVIQQVASGANRMVNERNPIVDARLNDGSRVNIICRQYQSMGQR